MSQATMPAPTTARRPKEPPLMAHGSVLQTGITNGKIGMWVFLASEVMFFTGLIGAYIVLRFAQTTWALPTDDNYPLAVLLTAINTFFLICSSVTLVAALQAVQAGNNRLATWMLVVTTLLGALFVSIQAYEYYEMYMPGYYLPNGEFNEASGWDPEVPPTRPNTDLFASCFYTMTGFHGFHVFLGVVALAVVTVMCAMGKFTPKNYATLENTGLYWHFVDLVWIILFAIVYLM